MRSLHTTKKIYVKFIVALFSVFIGIGGLAPNAVSAQGATIASHLGEVCYAVADERALAGQDDQQDTLTRLDRQTAQSDEIGLTGTTGIEAITFGPGHLLYAENRGVIGTLDLTTGAFTSLPQPLGTAGGVFGELQLQDVDALAFSLDLGILFGALRRSGAALDLLFAINPYTGAHIPDYFGPAGGPKTDYVPVPAILDEANNQLTDVDDMQFNPVTNELYAAMNTDGAGGSLVKIDISTGVPTRLFSFRLAGSGALINDVEGLSFDNTGLMYGSTGDNFSGDPDMLNRLFRIDPATGLSTLVGAFPTVAKDYEALACLAAEAAIVLEKFTNGPGQLPDDADAPTGPMIDVGAPVTWTYRFTNTGGLTLTALSLVDDRLGPIEGPGIGTCFPDGTVLAPGQSLTCFATGVAEVGQYSNLGTVTATPIGATSPTPEVTDTDPSHYFGVAQPPASLGDRVWDDLDGDGEQDAGEPGIPGVTVTLFDTNNVQVGVPVTTDSNGLYAFTGLVPGSYYVVFGPTGLPSGSTFTSANQGTDDRDSDADATGKTPTVVLAPGQNYLDLDVGIVRPSEPEPLLGTIGDRLWLDSNKNGIQDAGENGVAGVQVKLFTADNTLVSTDTTDPDGLYLFTGLVAGSYYVEFAHVPDHSFTLYNVNNSQEAADSDALVPHLELTISDGNVEAEVGSSLTYSFFYSNTDTTLAATNMVISTTIPQGTSFVAASSSPNWLCTATTPGAICRLTVATLAPGTSGTAIFTVLLANDEAAVPDALDLFAGLTQETVARTDLVQLDAGEIDLTLDAGLVLTRFTRTTPTSTSPTSLPTEAQPKQQMFIYLPNVVVQPD